MTSPYNQWRKIFAFGPGMIVAITGIGASDVIVSTVAGATFGTSLLWAIALGAFFKWVLNDGIVRWETGTNTSLIHAWSTYLPRPVLFLFFLYLLVWIIGVSAALTSGCGLAIENLSHGNISSFWGGMTHSLLGALLVILGYGQKIEKIIKLLTGIMFVSVVGCALLSLPDLKELFNGLLFPRIPPETNTFTLSLIGGIGGSLTLLSYRYLHPLTQKRAYNSEVKKELFQAYFFTAVFCISIMIIASHVFYKSGIEINDQSAVKKMTEHIGTIAGKPGFYLYSIGFWATVTASLLGVWKIVPQITVDCFQNLFKHEYHSKKISQGTLLILTFAPLPLLSLGKPLALIILFTVLSSLFIPFLAFTLLYLNYRVSNHSTQIRNTPWQSLLQFIILILFSWIGFQELQNLIFK